jgi:FkbM family methyltransferase
LLSLRPRRLVWWLLGSAGAGWAVGLRDLPLFGGVVHAVSHRVWPKGCRDWFEVETGLAEGLVLLLDPRFDANVASGAVEPELQARLPQLIARGSVVWDVGAHVGFFALAIARVVGPEGRVVAFEADGVNVDALRAAAARNGVDNVDVRPVAVWSAQGTVEFQPRSDSSGGHGGVVESGGGIVVSATSLDAEAGEQRIPDLVKIDVEGAEEHVLIGARQLLADHRPIVICEVHATGRGNEGLLPRVEALFEEAGYAVEQLDPGRRPVHLLATPL